MRCDRGFFKRGWWYAPTLRKDVAGGRGLWHRWKGNVSVSKSEYEMNTHLLCSIRVDDLDRFMS